jgi:hypothetical protein
MKITRRQLRRIIREEISHLTETEHDEGDEPYKPGSYKAKGHWEERSPGTRTYVSPPRPDPSKPEPIPIEELTWQPDKDGNMKVSDAGGGDWWSTLDSEDDLPLWKEQVASHGPGSTVVFTGRPELPGLTGRWTYHSGPWAEKSRAYQSAKAATLAKWGTTW